MNLILGNDSVPLLNATITTALIIDNFSSTDLNATVMTHLSIDNHSNNEFPLKNSSNLTDSGIRNSLATTQTQNYHLLRMVYLGLFGGSWIWLVL